MIDYKYLIFEDLNKEKLKIKKKFKRRIYKWL